MSLPNEELSRNLARILVERGLIRASDAQKLERGLIEGSLEDVDWLQLVERSLLEHEKETR